MKVKLTRLEQGKSLRTNTVEGYTDNLPVLGQSFQMIGEGLEYGCRVVRTSAVRKIKSEQEGVYEIQTYTGSVYKIEVELAN